MTLLFFIHLNYIDWSNIRFIDSLIVICAWKTTRPDQEEDHEGENSQFRIESGGR